MGTIYDLTQVDLYQELENWRIESRWPKGKAIHSLILCSFNSSIWNR